MPTIARRLVSSGWGVEKLKNWKTEKTDALQAIKRMGSNDYQDIELGCLGPRVLDAPLDRQSLASAQSDLFPVALAPELGWCRHH